MKNCENCEKEHDGSYASGRFCSCKCSRGFSTKAKRKEINKKISKALIGVPSKKIKLPVSKICKCGIEFETKLNSRTYCSKSCSAKFTSRGWRNHSTIDWNKINSKSYEIGNNFVAGGTTKWIEYKNIKVQGSYEMKVCEILDNLILSGTICAWKYAHTRIKYIGLDEKEHTYIVDFSILDNNGNVEKLIEVKGRESEIDPLKWKAAKDQGFILEIWRKKDIFKERNEI